MRLQRALLPTGTVAAAGSSQATATAIKTEFVLVTGADGTKGVVLPTPVAGRSVWIKNDDAANAVLKIYPTTGAAINALSANASLDIAAKTSVRLICYSKTQWYSFPLLPS